MKNLIQIALGLVCVGFACTFDEQQKQNAIANNDNFSKFIWSADQTMNMAVGTGVIVNGICNAIMNNNNTLEKAVEELIVNKKI